MAKSLVERFWAKVQKTDSCWNWTGTKTLGGYGHFYVGPRGAPKKCAHRIAWELTHGTIPDGLYVLHHCDNPPCVRPDHLFLGTPQDNTDDMITKKRHGRAKLTEADVLTIRTHYATGSISQRTLAKQYNVSNGTIGFILRHESWRHLT